jgi:hypothetical protein
MKFKTNGSISRAYRDLKREHRSVALASLTRPFSGDADVKAAQIRGPIGVSTTVALLP